MACKTEGQMDRRKLQYKKILNLDHIANTIADKYDIEIDQPQVPAGNFEDVIDLNNAHMSLATYMHTAEYRFAYAVTQALRQNTNIEELSKILEDAGEALKIENGTVEEVFNGVQDRILDGMPCDETIRITMQEDHCISWEMIDDQHSAFWKEVKGNINNYYTLLTSYVSGILINTDYIYEIVGNEFFTIRQK